MVRGGDDVRKFSWELREGELLEMPGRKTVLYITAAGVRVMVPPAGWEGGPGREVSLA